MLIKMFTLLVNIFQLFIVLKAFLKAGIQNWTVLGNYLNYFIYSDEQRRSLEDYIDL